MRITLQNSTIYAVVDDADGPLVSQYQWSLVKKRTKYYAHARDKKRRCRIYMHRLIMGHPPGKLVDHINGETLTRNEAGIIFIYALDNRRSTNLRVCTHSQNMGNSKQHSDRTGKYKGVYFEASTQKYVAQICVNKKSRKIGRYKTAIEAAHAYDVIAILEWGEFSKCNFDNEQSSTE